MSGIFRWFISISVVVLLGAGGFAAWGYAEYVRNGPFNISTVILIPRGHSVDAISRLLKARGLIRSPEVFRVGYRIVDRGRSLKAGEYLIPGGASPRQLVELFDSGKTVVRRLTIAEGLTTQQILAQLRATEGLVGELPQLLAEGSLLPETYHFSYGDGRADLVARMQSAMDGLVAELWRNRATDLPLKSAGEAVTLASIIEKETGMAEERRRVAGVFINRLRKGMRLQSDPTVVYGLTEGAGPLGRPLTRKDLSDENPFNTYVIRALPPSPIANPGRASLEAAMDPIETEDFYFVADGTGGHLFARTLAQHNENVARWRRLQRERRLSNGN